MNLFKWWFRKQFDVRVLSVNDDIRFRYCEGDKLWLANQNEEDHFISLIIEKDQILITLNPEKYEAHKELMKMLK